VLAKIRALNRVLCVWETMRAALDSLAIVAPEWLRAHSQPEWVERYGPRSEDSRSPLGEAQREAFAEDIGRQGRELLDALFDPTAPEWLRQVPAVELLRQVWVQNYQRIDDVVRWRSSREYSSPIALHRLSLRVIWLITARSEARRGLATKCICVIAAKLVCLCSLRMWKPRLLPSLMMP